MLTQLKTFLSSYKIQIYLVLVAILTTVWLMDRHTQYEKGKSACIIEQQKQTRQAVADAIKKADEDRKELQKIEDEHKTNLVEINEAAAANPCSKFTDDELFILNRTIAQSNSRQRSGDGKMSKNKSNNHSR